jgi:uncharacterized metal-binding protein
LLFYWCSCRWLWLPAQVLRAHKGLLDPQGLLDLPVLRGLLDLPVLKVMPARLQRWANYPAPSATTTRR